MTTTVTLNDKKVDWDDLTKTQQFLLISVMMTGLALAFTGLAGIGVMIWGGVKMILGGGFGTLLTGGGLVVGAKLAGAGLQAGLKYGTRKFDFMKVLNKREEDPSPVAAMTPLAPDFNLEAAVALEKNISIRPAIKFKSKSKRHDFG
ncbi:MAG: hypothetical protein ACAH80_03285 [Alphaproteobacteria bacterium]